MNLRKHAEICEEFENTVDSNINITILKSDFINIR